jgi:hypothetical protein
MKTPTLENLGSLITYKEDGEDRCLGCLFHSEQHGTFDPTFGKVDVTKEQADIHNRLLDEAMLDGLDKNCEVGQGGTLYFKPGTNGTPLDKRGPHFVAHCNQVTTWGGTVVSTNVEKKGNSITFKRAGKTYRGRLQRDADCFNFKRVK